MGVVLLNLSVNLQKIVIFLAFWSIKQNDFYPIFYVNDVNELYEKIEFIKNNYSKLDFKSVIIGEDTNNNIKKLFKNLEK